MVLHRAASEEDKARLNRALETIRHRGPDGNGVFFEDRVGLGHARLSILDLSTAGAQPMQSAAGQHVISYNGEVYNFRDLAATQGLTGLRSQSDTEVVLELFARDGVDSFERLNGMFAFALLDRTENCLWLVRDRFGIKPLYIAETAQGVFFGSEIKALLTLNPEAARLNYAALNEWSYYGTTLGEQTLFSGLRRVPPGSAIRIDLSTLECRQTTWWTPAPPSIGKWDGTDIAGQTRTLLRQAVERQLVSDVPIGVFLSGGIDSSAITAFASAAYDRRLTSYSIGFDYDQGVNELPRARELAKRFNTDHNELYLHGAEMADRVETLVAHHDQPFSDAANLPLYLAGLDIRDTTKVVLQGDGGDELFGGYQRYNTLSRLGRMRLAAQAANVVNGLLPRNAKYYQRQRYINALRARPLSKCMALLLTVEDEAHPPTGIFTQAIRQRATQDPFQRYHDCAAPFADLPAADQMLLTDSQIILPDVFFEKVDRATMAASIEVRVPFLDNDLASFAQSIPAQLKIPGGTQKYILKKALEGLVPHEVLYGPKTGFGVPFGFWLKEALKPLFFDSLNRFEARSPGVLDRSYLETLYKDYLDGTRDTGFLLWKTLNLMIWSNTYDVDWEAGA